MVNYYLLVIYQTENVRNCLLTVKEAPFRETGLLKELLLSSLERMNICCWGV